MTVAWIIGQRGLLGGALASAVARRPGWRAIETDSLPWGDSPAINRAVDAGARILKTESESTDSRWAILWAAGAAVTASNQKAFDAERNQLTAILKRLSNGLPDPSRGAIFYASSAGGVYGGAQSPPFTETTEPLPISPYGWFKLAAENEIASFAQTNGISSLNGRIANLYGPGQKLDKMQGLISHIAKAQYSTTPAQIFVPLDTIRDYIYVDDCADLVLDAMEQLAEAPEPTHATKIFASGYGVTVGSVLGHFRAVTKDRPNVMLGRSAAAAFQANDLRLRSTVWPHLDRRELTPLPVGIRATINGILRSLQPGAEPQPSIRP